MVDGSRTFSSRGTRRASGIRSPLLAFAYWHSANLAAGRFGGGAPHAITSSESASSSCCVGVGEGDWGMMGVLVLVLVDGMAREGDEEEATGTWV